MPLVSSKKKKRETKSERRMNPSLPVYFPPGEPRKHRVTCWSCHKLVTIPANRRTCTPCFERGGENIIVKGVDQAQIARWVAGHCHGNVEDGTFSSVRSAYLGGDW